MKKNFKKKLAVYIVLGALAILAIGFPIWYQVAGPNVNEPVQYKIICGIAMTFLSLWVYCMFVLMFIVDIINDLSSEEADPVGEGKELFDIQHKRSLPEPLNNIQFSSEQMVALFLGAFSLSNSIFIHEPSGATTDIKDISELSGAIEFLEDIEENSIIEAKKECACFIKMQQEAPEPYFYWKPLVNADFLEFLPVFSG